MEQRQDQTAARNPWKKPQFNRLDVVGTLLLLFATISLSAAFQEAGSRFPWKSAYVITLITLSGLFWIALVFWERRVTMAGGPQEPVLPWRFIINRAMVGTLS